MSRLFNITFVVLKLYHGFFLCGLSLLIPFLKSLFVAHEVLHFQIIMHYLVNVPIAKYIVWPVYDVFMMTFGECVFIHGYLIHGLSKF